MQKEDDLKEKKELGFKFLFCLSVSVFVTLCVCVRAMKDAEALVKR